MEQTELRDVSFSITTPTKYVPLSPLPGAASGQGLATHNTAQTQQSNANPRKFVFHTLGVLEVVSPERPNLVLATYIPYCEADILIFHCFHIKPFGGENVNSHWPPTPDSQIVSTQ